MSKRLITGQTSGGVEKPVLVDSTGAIVTTAESGTNANVKITDGTNTVTITNVSGKKSLDVNVADITIDKSNDSIATWAADEQIRMDEGASTSYYGYAPPGTATSAASWKIVKVTSTSKLYADGNANYDNVWDNRASLSYS